MNSKKINNKLKIFVTYRPGSGGQFMCLLLISLQKPVTLTNKYSGHAELHLISVGQQIQGFQFSEEFLKYTEADMDLDVGSAWLRKNFNFYDTNQDYYTIHTLLKNIDVVTKAWPEAKIIKITTEESDVDQMWYNWITKSMTFHQDWWRLKERVLQVQKLHNRLHWVDVDNMDNYQHDIKLCCYIMKFSKTQPSRVQHEHNLERCYSIPFQDMFNKNLINHLDPLIEFLSINTDYEKKMGAIKLINEYADAQKTVPWKILLEDYQ